MEYITMILPWVISVCTILILIETGNKNPKTWLYTMGNQVLWLIWIVLSKNWGLLPMNLVIWYVSIKNHRKWNRLNNDK